MGWVLVVMDPYETGEVTGVVGTFDTEDAAEKGRKRILKAGGHPDAEYHIHEIVTLEAELDNVDEMSEEDDDDSE